MNSRTKGVVAGVAGIALLTGGGTFALWTDTAQVDGGAITSGNLDVAIVGTATWRDVSPGRTAHPINLDSFRMVPGDTIEGRFDVDAALQGDNMVAELVLTFAGGEVGSDPDLLDGLDLTYTVLNAEGAELPGMVDLPMGTSKPLTFKSIDNMEDDGLPRLTRTMDTFHDLTVVVTATFDPGTGDRHLAQARADLADLGVRLTQVRTVSDGA